MASLTKQTLATLKRIQFLSDQLSKELMAGAYRSAFRGHGIEFEEAREFESGDDIRSIDWNVTARMGKPYVKNFQEERDLTVLLLVDISASTRYGSHYGRKSEWIAELGALLAFCTIQNNDRIGLLLFSDEVELYLPPRKGRRHVQRIIRDLLVFNPKHSGSSIKKALNFLGKLQMRPAICFLISDFISPSFNREATLIARKHDLIAISVLDPYEKELPSLGLTHLEDLETGESGLVDLESPALKKLVKERVNQRITQQRKSLEKAGASFIDLQTNSSYVEEIRKFFRLRKQRRR